MYIPILKDYVKYPVFNIAKADIDDKLKNLEKKLNLTQQQLSAEKFKNSQLDLKSKSANLEINKLRKSIE